MKPSPQSFGLILLCLHLSGCAIEQRKFVLTPTASRPDSEIVTERDLEELDREFPPPNGPVPLEML